jgi:hypothetical protein
MLTPVLEIFGKGRLTSKAENVTAICEPIV